VKMAHYAQTVNVIGCVKTTKTGAFMSATALPLMLYRPRVWHDSGAISGNCADAKLDVAAAWTEDRKALTIGLVNPMARKRSSTSNCGGETGREGHDLEHRRRRSHGVQHGRRPALGVKQQDGIDFSGVLKVAPYSVTLVRLPIK